MRDKSAKDLKEEFDLAYETFKKQYPFVYCLAGLIVSCFGDMPPPKDDAVSEHNINVGYEYYKVYRLKNMDFQNACFNWHELCRAYIRRVEVEEGLREVEPRDEQEILRRIPFYCQEYYKYIDGKWKEVLSRHQDVKNKTWWLAGVGKIPGPI
jgi:hypothetical protein